MNSTTKNRITRALTTTGFRVRALVASLLTAAAVSACGVNDVSAPAGTYGSSGMHNGDENTVTTHHGVGALATISIAPSPATVRVGQTQQFTAVGEDARGNAVAITPTWSIVNGGGTINGNGLFTASMTPGTYHATVKASQGSVSSTVTVTVTPAVTVKPLATITVTPNPASLGMGVTQQFTAVGKDADGGIVAVVLQWSVEAGGGTISSTSGLFTAGNTSGTFTNTVRARVGSISGFATVVVTGAPPAAVATIAVTPSPVSIEAGGTRQFTAVAKDVDGNVLVIAPVWSVVSGGGSISSSGLFTAGGAAGTFTSTVKATSGAVSGFATVTVTVTNPTLATITVTPNPAALLANATRQFTAIGRDANGNVFPISPVWSVINGGGTIDPVTGLFTAGAVAGTFAGTVKAEFAGKHGTATVIVTTVPPPPPSVPLGGAALNGIMAGTAVTCITGGKIFANVSISPGNTITGFGPCVITGVQHLNDAVAKQDQIDLTNAYNTLAGLPCSASNAIVANLGGTTKPAGVYCTASGIGVTGTLTLDGGGDPNAMFVFQAGSSLTTAGSIVLINGAQARNVYWQVGSSATIGTASQWQGNILALTSITLVDNATLTGRALARNGAVTLGTNNIIILP